MAKPAWTITYSPGRASGRNARLASLTMPPKSIRARRSSLLSTLNILPGTPRHMSALPHRLSCDEHLPQRNPAVVGRHDSRGMDLESGSFEPCRGAAQQVFVLKASAAQHHTLDLDASCDLHGKAGERIVKTGGDARDRSAGAQVFQ